MAKDIEEKIGAMSQQNCHGLKYEYPLKTYRVHEMPTGDQLPPHYVSDRNRPHACCVTISQTVGKPMSIYRLGITRSFPCFEYQRILYS